MLGLNEVPKAKIRLRSQRLGRRDLDKVAKITKVEIRSAFVAEASLAELKDLDRQTFTLKDMYVCWFPD